MEIWRTVQLAVLLIVMPPFIMFLGMPIQSTSVSSSVAWSETSTYTSTIMRTYFTSSRGITTSQSPMSFPARVIGFIAAKGKCAIFYLPVRVTSGSELNLHMQANNPVNFYLLPEGHEAELGRCDTVSNPILNAINFTAFTLNWTAPKDGTFYLVFTGPTATIFLSDNGSLQPVAQTAMITYATSTQTSLQVSSTTSSRTLTTTTLIQQPFILQSGIAQSTLIAAVALIILTIALFLLSKNRRKRPL